MKRNFLVGLAIGFLVFGMATMANAALIAHWGFDETSGSTALATVGGVNGTLVSGPSGAATFTGTGGIVGGAISITGNLSANPPGDLNGGYVDMGDYFGDESFGINPAFSVQAWVQISSGNTDGMIPVSKHWGGIAQGYFLLINNAGVGNTNTESFYTANGSYQTAVGGPPVNDGLWHQLVGVYSSGHTWIYVDGLYGGEGLAGYADNDAHFIVGGASALLDNPNHRNFFNGLIDEVKIFNTALSGSEVEALYNSYTSSAPVPEPATMLLLGSGLVGLAGFRRKLRKR